MDYSVLEGFQERYPGRKNQIDQLFQLYAFKDEPFVDSVYIYGSSSTGKTHIITALLDELGIKSAYVNLIECYTSKILFESILNQLSGHKIDPYKGQPYATCDNMMDFVFNLKKCSERDVDLNKSVIVLDKAEHFRNMDHNLLAGFLRLRELSGLAISLILVSEIVFEKYYSITAILEPIKIHFPQYTKEELLEILSLDYENAQETIVNNYGQDFEITKKFFNNYLNLFLSVFYRVCRDLSELRHMSKLNFLKYCEPILKGDCKIEDSMGLWRHIAPILKSSLELLYLRISTVDQERKQRTIEMKYQGTETGNNKVFTFTKENLAQSLELPFYAKYLLIASYLASYNPHKQDKRLFMKHHGKKKKTLKNVKSKSIVSEQFNTQLGPKPFGFERLVAIFYAILEEKVDFNGNLLAQISTLVELQLLSTISDNCDLDSRKYKCCVGLDFIQIVAKTVDFDVTKYLVDFN